MAKYRDLIVFQKADALAFSIYKTTEDLTIFRGYDIVAINVATWR